MTISDVQAWWWWAAYLAAWHIMAGQDMTGEQGADL